MQIQISRTLFVEKAGRTADVGIVKRKIFVRSLAPNTV